MAHFGREGKPETVIEKISQDTLACMVGTTRSRVGFFLTKFRKLGFVCYNAKWYLTGWFPMHSFFLKIGLQG